MVPVELEPEPDNFWDPNAIAFMCCTDQKWIRIGYIVVVSRADSKFSIRLILELTDKHDRQVLKY